MYWTPPSNTPVRLFFISGCQRWMMTDIFPQLLGFNAPIWSPSDHAHFGLLFHPLFVGLCLKGVRGATTESE